MKFKKNRICNIIQTHHRNKFVTLSVNCIRFFHYSDAIKSAMMSQITGVTIVYSTVCSGADQIKHQSSASLGFVGGNSPVTGEFPTQRTRNAENISIWWRHHVRRWDSISGGKNWYYWELSSNSLQLYWVEKFHKIAIGLSYFKLESLNKIHP